MDSQIFSILTAILATLGGVVSVAFEIVAKYIKTRKDRQKDSQDIAEKIKSISASLSKSAIELVNMQEQLKERIAFVEDLTIQAKRAEEIASLNKGQLNAVNEILSTNLKKEGRRSLWQGIVINFIFFILGAAASYLIAVYLLKR